MGGSTPPPAASTPSPLSYGGALADDFGQINAMTERYRKEGELSDEQARRQKEFAEKEKKMGEEREKELAPRYAAVDKALSQPHPPIPQQERPPDPPKPEDFKKMSMDYLAAFTLLGAFGGAMVRNKANAPLKAFSATIGGWQEGNMQAYKEASEEWKQKNAQVLELNRQRMEEYRLILEDQHLTMDEQMNRLKIASAKWQDRIMWERTTVNDGNGVAQAYAMGTKSLEQAQESSRKLVDRLTQDDAQASARAEQFANGLATPQGAKWWNDPNVPAEEKFRAKAFIQTYAPDKYAMLWGDAAKPPISTEGPGERTGGVPSVEPPPGTPMDTATTPTATPKRNMPPEYRQPFPPVGMKGKDRSDWYFEKEIWEKEGRPPTDTERGQHDRRTHPARTSAALSMQEFIDETVATTGAPPSAHDLIQFDSERAGEVARGRTAGTMSARASAFSDEVEQAIEPAILSSRQLPRGRIVPFNQLVQQWEKGTSDPRYNDFMVKNLALLNAYVRAMNPQGVPRVAERLETHALGLLSMATDQRSYEVQVQALWQEVVRTRRAIENTRKGGPASEEFPGPPPRADSSGKTPQFTPDEITEEMKRRGLQ